MAPDECSGYYSLGDHFQGHESVSHKVEEYVRGEVRTNTVEGYFSIFKRGMKGVNQHCSDKHLPRRIMGLRENTFFQAVEPARHLAIMKVMPNEGASYT